MAKMWHGTFNKKIKEETNKKKVSKTEVTKTKSK